MQGIRPLSCVYSIILIKDRKMYKGRIQGNGYDLIFLYIYVCVCVYICIYIIFYNEHIYLEEKREKNLKYKWEKSLSDNV